MKLITSKKIVELMDLKPTSRISKNFLERAKYTLQKKKKKALKLKHFWEFDAYSDILVDIETLEKTMNIY